MCSLYRTFLEAQGMKLPVPRQQAAAEGGATSIHQGLVTHTWLSITVGGLTLGLLMTLDTHRTCGGHACRDASTEISYSVQGSHYIRR